MDVSAEIQKGLEDECRKLHRGESVRMAMRHIDANAVHAIRTVVESLYRGMFGEELHIEEMKRDACGVLHISVTKK